MINSFPERKKKQRKSESPLNYALKLLARKDYSQFELQEKLKKKFTEEEIKNTVKKLVELRLLSDERYVKRTIEKYAFIKKYGYLKVQFGLLRKGIKYSVFSPILEAEYSEEKEKENALSLSNERPVDKLKGYLVSRGYRLNVIREVLAELKENRR